MNTADDTRAGLRLALLLAGSAIVLIGVIALATAIGDYNIPVRSVFLAVTNHFGLTTADIPRIEQSVVWNLRLSRSLVAALCGAGLAICGAINEETRPTTFCLRDFG